MNGRTNSHGSIIDDLQVPLDPCTNFRAEAGNGSITLYWDDPVDKYATPEGETAQDPQQLVSVWDHTIVVRKVGSQPANPNDGIIVTSSGVRDQYLSTGYTDASLTNDTTYYYGVFAVNEDGVASDGAFISATPVIGNPLSELAEGTLIKIMENGSPVEFYLAKHNYEPDLNGEGRELMVRNGCFSYVKYTLYTGDSDLNDYMRSSLASACSSYVSNLSEAVQSKIGTTEFHYYIVETVLNLNNYQYYYNYTNTTGTAAIFNPSATELGCTSNHSGDGTRLPNYRSMLPNQVTSRSSASSPGGGVQWCFHSGEWKMTTISEGSNFLPCFTLPNDLLVDHNLNLLIEF